jgi:KDO2-lipid IV(A) lauroyltransferase
VINIHPSLIPAFSGPGMYGGRVHEAAIARGKGAILALPHLGGWEWAGRWLSAQGHNVTAVVEDLENREVFAWFSDLRSKIGIDVIAFDDRAGIRVGAALRENHVVCLLCDRDIARAGKRTGVAVDFFGERTTVPAGPALFAIRTGAALLPVASSYIQPCQGQWMVPSASLPRASGPP